MQEKQRVRQIKYTFRIYTDLDLGLREWKGDFLAGT